MSAVEKADKGALSLNLLGREFRVACPEGEEKILLASADYLNRRLKEVRDTGKVSGNERIAIMAALNIAHEMMSKPDSGNGFRVIRLGPRFVVELPRCRRRSKRRWPPIKTSCSRFPAAFVRAYIL